MTDDSPANDKSRVIKVGRGGLFSGFALLALWLFGFFVLDDLLAIDIDCLERSGRRAALVETVVCSLGEGWRGWAYLAWTTAFPLLGFRWLRRKLHGPVKNRK